jgi:hypothetical protein
MKFPYGICDFYKIITQNYFYIDRTDRIPTLEQAGEQLLFLRPRRFGKSLLLSMLENYYDLAKAEEFEQLFGHLKIGAHPTPKHNHYLVMKWDFSMVESQGEAQRIRHSIHAHINNAIIRFGDYYASLLPRQIIINADNALSSFESLLTSIQATSYKLYLLIDEYDNFANEVMMNPRINNQAHYKELVYGEGLVKSIFKVVKGAAAGRGLDRVFITGVSPLVLSDITSGYNVAKNVYFHPALNELCGFTETEIGEVLQSIKLECNLSSELECNLSSEQTGEALAMMRTFYNGYRFSEVAKKLIYNPTLVLYFLEQLADNGRSPREILDANLAMDQNKIVYLSQLSLGQELILRALTQSEPLAVAKLVDRFGMEEILTEEHDESFMVSLLYYFGVLTLAGHNEFGELILGIPNLVIRKLYVERLVEMLLSEYENKKQVTYLTRQFYSRANLQPLCDFITAKYFKIFDNRDYRWSNELTVKTAVMIVLFNDDFYMMESETSLSRHYADLSLIIRPDMRQYQLLDHLIEFKYLSLKTLELTAAMVKSMSLEELKVHPLVQEQIAQAQVQLQPYQHSLIEKYGEQLRLHTHVVVALGFERLVSERLN